MPWSWRHAWMAAALGGGLLLGCGSSGVKDPYPPDPLFLSKKPVEARPDNAAPAIVHNEPPVPLVPALALASAPRDRLNALLTSTGQRLPEDAGPPARKPVPALPASATEKDKLSLAPLPSRPAADDAAPTTPAPKPVAGNFGHALDYTWLQGVLDRRYLAHSDLHYNDSPMEDTWGGKVCLEPDPRLAEFHDGDVVFVQGEIVREHGKAVRDVWNHYPRYRLRSVELVRHAEPRPGIGALINRVRKEEP